MELARQIIGVEEYTNVFNELLELTGGLIPDGNDCFGYFIQRGYTLYYRERPHGWNKNFSDPMDFLFYKREI